jgi:Trp operon repressor
MELLNLEMEQHRQQQRQIQWRRDKDQDLSSKGHSQREIASYLKVGIGTVNRDLVHLRLQAKENIKRYVDEKLPEEYEKCLAGLNGILREAWSVSQQANDSRIEKIKALTLAKECYAMKLELLTNATVVDDAIRFVSSHTVATAIERDNAGYGVTLDKDEESDVQRSKKSHSQRSTRETTTTTNTVF